MIISSLNLDRFRSYTTRKFEFSPSLTLIIGDNASGKTNILEALVMASTGKSFRADTDREVIQWGEEFSRVTAHVGDSEAQLLVTTGVVATQPVPTKKYIVNGIPRRSIDFVGTLRTVLFWPEHMELVTDSPSVRRKYLDSVLVQVDREYRRNLVSYEKGLRQRNKLLSLMHDGKAQRHQLLFWDQLLIRTGAYVTQKRAELIDYINAFHCQGPEYTIVYDKSIISNPRLQQYEQEEVAAKATLVGPHRDDFIVQIKTTVHDFVDASKYGSRGEQRLAIFWMKLAELSYIERIVGDRPVLLLDDIFSELDESHQSIILELIEKQQTILTTADENIETLFHKFNDTTTIHLQPKT